MATFALANKMSSLSMKNSVATTKPLAATVGPQLSGFSVTWVSYPDSHARPASRDSKMQNQ